MGNKTWTGVGAPAPLGAHSVWMRKDRTSQLYHVRAPGHDDYVALPDDVDMQLAPDCLANGPQDTPAPERTLDRPRVREGARNTPLPPPPPSDSTPT